MQKRRAIAAVGVHAENSIFLFEEELAIGRPAKRMWWVGGC